MARRRKIVEAVRGGLSQRAAARRFGVSLATVQRWVARSAGQRLDRVDFAARPRGGARRATPLQTQQLVLSLRRSLAAESDLGECGAVAIHRALGELGHAPLPSVRTIGRILVRGGALDGQRRVRRASPPKAWHLPGAVGARAEVDSFDIVEGLRIKDGPAVEVLNAISLFGGVAQSWPQQAPIATTDVLAMIVEHWRRVGLPGFAHFDNDTIFQGAHQWPDSIGRVTRLCLRLGVVPVFAPPREQGFQADIESFNGRWQAKVWSRFRHADMAALRAASARYIDALHARGASRRDAAPARAAFPNDFAFDPAQPPRGTLIFVRRTDDHGDAIVLGHRLRASPQWPCRLVRATVDLDAGTISFHALRRREHAHQPLLSTHPYTFPKGKPEG